MALIPSMMLFSFLSFLVILKSEANNDQLQFVYHYCNNEYGNITTETYSDNRNNLLSNMYYDKENDYGFYNSSYGQDPDKVYAIGFCRGDANLDKCRSCLEKSAVLLRERCPVQKEGIGWFDECMLRYTNHSIFGVMVTQPNNIMCNTKNAPKDPRSAAGFDQVVHNLLNELRNRTTTVADPESDSSRSRKFFAEGDAPVQSSNVTIHALIQCTPDISSQNCTRCLEHAMTNILYCDGKRGGRYLGPSCSVRYEIYPFFEPIVHHAPPPQPATQVTTTTGKGEGGEGELDNDIKIDELLQFDFATIKFATNNFSDANKLGQGGFGIVYKGTLSDGQEIAIKRLSINSNQGETEFKNEILLTGKLQHRNLVRLLGFCFSRRERLLIYEFVPNKSLDYFIFDPNNRVNLNWERRYNIIRGIARGLLYLHEDSRLQVVHRDLKTSNILLDEELNPKISDFGMARLFEINQTQASTNTIVGTFFQSSQMSLVLA
uniref:Uncharacterized protein n=1 Tax=Glycine max TaxID=3847 RepID=A0A0R0EMH2_SOYBN